MVEADIGITDIVAAVASFETGIHVLEQLDTPWLEFDGALVVVHLLYQFFHQLAGDGPFEVYPVNSP